MEGHCAAVVCGWSCPTVRNAPAPGARHHPGVVDHAMTTAGEARPLGVADPPGEGASAGVAAGRSPETVGGRGLCHGTGTTNRLDLSPGHAAAPGLMTESKGHAGGLRRTFRTSESKAMKKKISNGRLSMDITAPESFSFSFFPFWALVFYITSILAFVFDFCSVFSPRYDM